MRGLEQIPWLYDLVSAIAERLGADVWRDRVVSDARGLTLEVGAGTGRNLSRYPKHARVIALEPDRVVAGAARRRTGGGGGGVPMVIGSAEALPFRESVFDAAVSCLVFCSVPDPLRGLHEVRRVLKPKATLHMLEHVRSTGRVGARLQDLIQPAWTAVSGGCHPNRDTEANVEAAGFVIDGPTRRRRGNLRFFHAQPLARASGDESPETSD